MSIEAAFFGTLGRDSEPKTSKAAGKPYLRLAVRIGDGESAQWISVNSFDASADPEKLKKGARVYVEGRLSLDTWTGKDGTERTGLSCMSGHTRTAQIGRNKPPKHNAAPTAAPRSHDHDDLDDTIGF